MSARMFLGSQLDSQALTPHSDVPNYASPTASSRVKTTPQSTPSSSPTLSLHAVSAPMNIPVNNRDRSSTDGNASRSWEGHTNYPMASRVSYSPHSWGAPSPLMPLFEERRPRSDSDAVASVSPTPFLSNHSSSTRERSSSHGSAHLQGRASILQSIQEDQVDEEDGPVDQGGFFNIVVVKHTSKTLSPNGDEIIDETSTVKVPVGLMLPNSSIDSFVGGTSSILAALHRNPSSTPQGRSPQPPRRNLPLPVSRSSVVEATWLDESDEAPLILTGHLPKPSRRNSFVRPPVVKAGSSPSVEQPPRHAYLRRRSSFGGYSAPSGSSLTKDEI
jgi:hypothetical protein